MALKVAVLSDLHLEFGYYNYNLPDADCIILAGDIYSPQSNQTHVTDLLGQIDEKYGHDNVMMLEGNHEQYTGSADRLMHKRYNIVKDGVAFIGCTLWSGNESQMAYTSINDSSYIAGFTWCEMLKWHNSDVEFIRNALEEHADKKTVVFTHHLPSIECINERWLNSHNYIDMNYAFYTDLDYILNQYKPDTWIGGHTHDSLDKIHSNGHTRLVINPRGYARNGVDENKEFNPSKTIDI
ncbi:MAG: metallophosphoesterase [Ghiorsea sp.]